MLRMTTKNDHFPWSHKHYFPKQNYSPLTCVESTIRIVKAKHCCPHLDVFYVHSSSFQRTKNTHNHLWVDVKKIWNNNFHQIFLFTLMNLKKEKIKKLSNSFSCISQFERNQTNIPFNCFHSFIKVKWT
jgi:hypothetical protein